MTQSLPYRLVFLVLTLATYGCSAPVALQRHTVMVDDHPIAVWAKSAPHAAASVLLVHGRTWSAVPDFDLQVEGEELSLMDGLVERGYAVYAVDLRGYGQTPRDATQWLTPNRAADDVAAVLRWIDGERPQAGTPHLFGWSMGSTVSQLALQRHPSAAASLTLFGYWRDDDQTLPADAPGITPQKQRNTARAAASDFILPGSISQKAIDTYVAAALAADPVRVDVRSVDQYNALDAAMLNLPTLIIFGEHDPIAPLERQIKLYERVASGHKQLVSIPGGDHAAYLEAPREQFLEALDGFFESVSLAR